MSSLIHLNDGQYWLRCALLFSALFFCSKTMGAFACEKELAAIANLRLAAPAAPPKPAPAPLPSKPRPKPNTPHPRRSVPLPKEPTPYIPARPVKDPKNVVDPTELYSSDTKLVGFWNDIPIGLRRVMVEGLRRERVQLRSHIEERYGTSDPQRVHTIALKLLGELTRLEKEHKPELVGLVRQMFEERYGDRARNLTLTLSELGVGESLPAWPEKPWGNKDGRQIPSLPEGWYDGMVFRTELSRLWQQGEGWIGSKEFAFGMADKIDAISPGLSEKYQEMDRLYRFGELLVLDVLNGPEQVAQMPRDGGNVAREIVDIDFEIVERPDGSRDAQVREGGVNGVAAGANGWALAHEGRKALAQMSTPLEGAHRWMMPTSQREKLDAATNSGLSEIRQGFFGPFVTRAIRERLAILYSRGEKSTMADADYYYMVEGLFSMPPTAFKHSINLMFASNFNDPAHLRQVTEFFEESGVFPSDFGRSS